MDRKKFGNASEQAASNLVTNEWQNAIDDALLTAAPVVVPGGLDQDEDDDDDDEAEAGPSGSPQGSP